MFFSCLCVAGRLLFLHWVVLCSGCCSAFLIVLFLFRLLQVLFPHREVRRLLDQLATQTGLNPRWCTNTKIHKYANTQLHKFKIHSTHALGCALTAEPTMALQTGLNNRRQCREILILSRSFLIKCESMNLDFPHLDLIFKHPRFRKVTYLRPEMPKLPDL